MQRVRVGLTGLGAVLLIVAISAAIFESASNQPAGNAVVVNQSEQTVANLIGNAVEAPTEPLAEMGVTPGGPPTPAANATAPAAK